MFIFGRKYESINGVPMKMTGLFFFPPPQKINEKPQIIADYECGKAIPNNQVMGKIERAIGKLTLPHRDTPGVGGSGMKAAALFCGSCPVLMVWLDADMRCVTEARKPQRI